MKNSIDGKAIVYCEKLFNTLEGKTAHGLVRYTGRYEVVGVIDSRYAGQDAGMVLDKKPRNIPVFSDFETAYKQLSGANNRPENFVIGLAPDGGRLPKEAKLEIKKALEKGLNVDSGLHDFVSNDYELMAIALTNNCRVRDVRKTPDRDLLHFFTGEIENVDCLKLAVLGTDSAIGKRTTTRILVQTLNAKGYKAEMIGTGQTAWFQGTKYCTIIDSCINDFVSGEIEHAIVSAWQNEKPDVIVIEGQGSLMNPAYPGGFEILAAGRPDFVILQHAPRRLEYDGFPGYVLHSLDKQINAIQAVSGKKVIAITLNHQFMEKNEIPDECQKVSTDTGLPCFDVLAHGANELVELLNPKIKNT